MVTPLNYLTIKKESGGSFASRCASFSESEWFFMNIKFAPIGKQD
jgi:hypothetical protein